jgi:hypothetical protein
MMTGTRGIRGAPQSLLDHGVVRGPFGEVVFAPQKDLLHDPEVAGSSRSQIGCGMSGTRTHRSGGPSRCRASAPGTRPLAATRT